ncbi:hypothetical protein [Streptacidiphilus rugosus]|uniref:hypothetical protein n=1 Tax=Streptacidiphilus rugosus TaxID=405783 RepID=UPI0038CD3B2C
MWLDGDLYFTSSPEARKARNLAANPACTFSARLEGIDIVAEGEAARVTEVQTLERIAAVYRGPAGPPRSRGTPTPRPSTPPVPARRRGTSTGCGSTPSSVSPPASPTARPVGGSRTDGRHRRRRDPLLCEAGHERGEPAQQSAAECDAAHGQGAPEQTMFPRALRGLSEVPPRGVPSLDGRRAHDADAQGEDAEEDHGSPAGGGHDADLRQGSVGGALDRSGGIRRQLGVDRGLRVDDGAVVRPEAAVADRVRALAHPEGRAGADRQPSRSADQLQ